MDEDRSTKPDRDEEKTGYALDRTVLANERTYAAWLRTGIAALAAGVAIEKFMVQVLPEWGIRSIAIILIVFSGLAFGLAGWRYTHLGVKLDNIDVKMVPSIVTTLLSIFLVVCSIIALISVWFLEPATAVEVTRLATAIAA
jgi:putative membrane protein